MSAVVIFRVEVERVDREHREFLVYIDSKTSSAQESSLDLLYFRKPTVEGRASEPIAEVG